MSAFQGGSAYNMVVSVADGYIILTERTFKRYTPGEIAEFLFETDKLLREVRAAQAPAGDQEAVQKRQRKMQRLQQGLTIANAVRSRKT
ncbi:MAG: hypothetical protein ACRD00_07905 [Thermoanaerobaculia bacterium]